MAKYTIDNIERFSTYFTVRLKPTDNIRSFDFLPGQYATISFKTNGRWSPARCFSMTNSPRSKELLFATRLTGRFTEKLATLKPGTPINIQGPYGNFNIDRDFDKQIVMLAGGIGITPFMSMLSWAAEIKLPNPITLLYACNSIDDTPFRREIEKLKNSNSNLRVLFLVSKSSTEKASGVVRGQIDNDLLNHIIQRQSEDSTFFICGPQGFTKSISKLLRSRDIKNDRLVVESFTQATSLGWGIKLSIPSLTYATASLALLAGIGFFMTIDLSRYLPKAEAKIAHTPTSNGKAPVNVNSVPANTSSGIKDYSTTSSSSNQTYQAPVTTVS